MQINSYNKNQDPNIKDLDEINLGYLFNFLFRSKNLIFSCSLGLFLLSIIYSFTLKKVWQGEFQIVLNSNEKQSTTMLNPALKNFAGLKDNEDNLKTQVGILESPSLLKPIFDFVVEKELKTKNLMLIMIFGKKTV